ncbi:asparagine synthase (glutamine-hydrolyzing) [Candidatus Giovannonibacteria bacterium RIFCSPLOWO2_12_FULL_44_25]|uniref:asparagine synthase (glutamine-hydrolyzing) n=2 Tax=Candidatus Giovannoniibacteriota TaxID=1752738 RepID=A0A1F5WAX1_9BACT|nr:MAG: Asparagine synthetase [Parcubacteria group bacterium GW2011_GWC1_44_10]KKT60467.1 MAG: Asparagine synthetase [Candidatus Giovannonibacteria bacterium GW2011_GWA1_44_25]KKU30325.1 MAG: Asparagine synthetase [Candidatus Giovannonibacteria bacterium GW2011_GWB1_46_20]OGF50529.1 MAG: asparagine synthase (glutamine-hydrolyzing) [Candidatus Giovannonibacteria bacterium GWA2_45_15]OGF60765.1 MAG: asparagine synthase (glutamine-hydrolyzing) [Candidatus Giovannonibacteria bacterium RIFCSPHIGHO2_
MCAINGFNFKDEGLILKMNLATRHRGPDGAGIFLDDKISLGHNRLSIIDLSDAAKQPMESGDERLIIVFNGEIYNFKELKKELANFYNFKTLSDTEVILAAYKKWGPEAVKKLNGIFAFAIWDKEKRELFLARDPIGVKPLYYFLGQNKFVFSSEIKAILEHDVPRILDRGAFNHYLRVLYTPAPHTMFEGIYKFPAAHYGVLSAKDGSGELKLMKYWDIDKVEYFNAPLKKIAEDLRGEVLKAVKRQLISDRPIGLYLSGGIDSSAVLDAMREARSNIDTFSVGFTLPNKSDEEKFNQDFYLARRTAKYYGTNHHEILLSEDDASEYFEKTIYQLDEPIANPTAIPMMKLAEFTKSKWVDVVLGGDGGDELFGGYERYRLSRALNYVPGASLVLPEGVRKFARFMFQKDPVLREVMSDQFFDRNISYSFFTEHYFKSNPFKTFEELFMSVDRRTWLVDESLMRTDKMSMSSAVEARVPLLDKDLIEFAARVPLKYKVGLFDKKIILKEAFRGRIPDFLLNQPKRGWFSPGAKWLRNPKIRAAAEHILSRDYYNETAPIFNWANIDKILKDHVEGRKYNFNVLWSILSFQVWAKIYKVKI